MFMDVGLARTIFTDLTCSDVMFIGYLILTLKIGLHFSSDLVNNQYAIETLNKERA